VLVNTELHIQQMRADVSDADPCGQNRERGEGEHRDNGKEEFHPELPVLKAHDHFLKTLPHSGQQSLVRRTPRSDERHREAKHHPKSNIAAQPKEKTESERQSRVAPAVLRLMIFDERHDVANS
jgi:hypothetical protein